MIEKDLNEAKFWADKASRYANIALYLSAATAVLVALVFILQLGLWLGWWQ